MPRTWLINSHLQSITTANDIIASKSYSENISKETNLQIMAITSLVDISEELKSKFNNIFNVCMYVKPPWF